MTDFGSIYTLSLKNGTVIPETNAVKSTLETAFKEIFGSDLCVDAETPMGRLIEALTLLFVNVIGVNAQNANSFNPSQAIGSYLDSLGAMFGVPRLIDESDALYRKRLLESQSRGSGFAQAIRQAISNVEGVDAVCVLENGHADPQNLPNAIHGISVPGHSIFVCVNGGEDSDVARAIYNTKSAGCGYEATDEFGTLVEETIEDELSGSQNSVYFHRPVQLPVRFQVRVSDFQYTGSSIETSTADAIRAYIKDHSMNTTVTATEIAAAIGSDKSGIICKSVTMKIEAQTMNEITALPYQHINITDIEVTVE